jgi:hypothetical protein
MSSSALHAIGHGLERWSAAVSAHLNLFDLHRIKTNISKRILTSDAGNISWFHCSSQGEGAPQHARSLQISSALSRPLSQSRCSLRRARGSLTATSTVGTSWLTLWRTSFSSRTLPNCLGRQPPTSALVRTPERRSARTTFNPIQSDVTFLIRAVPSGRVHRGHTRPSHDAPGAAAAAP